MPAIQTLPVSFVPGASEPTSATRTAVAGEKKCPSCGSAFPNDFVVCPRDATPLVGEADSQRDPYLGALLEGTYRVLAVVGEGGMGRVYEVAHARLPHRRYALKMLLPEVARNPELVARFSREAEAASKIGHPNVIEVFDVGRTQDGHPFLVSELLQGEELGDVLGRIGKLDVPTAAYLVRQVCGALGAAHAQGVVHRDLKPENLFLVGDPARPIVKVIDFGISKQGDGGGAGLTRTGMVMGTPAYMAPEQARGDRVDARADVYATGAILYRMLTGQTPFACEDASTTLTAVLTQEPVRARAVAPEVPEALEMVLERAMAKDPEARYASMAELDAALAPFDTTPTAVAMVAQSAPRPDGVGRSADARAPTLLAAAAPVSENVARDTREAKLARPAVVALTLIASLAVFAGAADTLGSVIMLAWTERALGGVDAILIVGGLAATGITPFVLWVRWIARRVWGSTVRAVSLARSLRAATMTGLATYGALALVVRVGLDVAQRTPREIASPMWGPLLFVAAIAASTVAVVVTRAASGRNT